MTLESSLTLQITLTERTGESYKMADWDTLFADEREFVRTEPHPFVLRAAEHLRRAKAIRVLDLGCGAGRHLTFLGGMGFAVYGCDISPRGLAISRRKLSDLHLRYHLALADMRALPFRNTSFDAVVSIHVLYHSTRRDLQTTLAEARRVLKPGGPLICTLISTKTWKYGSGTEIESDTYIQAEGPESGIPHHYSSEIDAIQLLQQFKLEATSHNEIRQEDARLDCHWEIMATRI